jgi:hypothetical protein
LGAANGRFIGSNSSEDVIEDCNGIGLDKTGLCGMCKGSNCFGSAVVPMPSAELEIIGFVRLVVLCSTTTKMPRSGVRPYRVEFVLRPEASRLEEAGLLESSRSIDDSMIPRYLGARHLQPQPSRVVS